MRAVMIGRWLAAALALQGCMASSQGVRQVGIYDLASERVSGADSVFATDASGFAELPVLVTVGIDGKVVKAEVLDNRYKLDPVPGLAAVPPNICESASVRRSSASYTMSTLPMLETPSEIALTFPSPS